MSRRRALPFIASAAGIAALGLSGYRLCHPTPASPRASAVPVTRPAAPAPPAPGTGTLEVTSNVAGATVSVDGRPLGTASQHVEGLSGGRHVIRVEKAGYPPYEQEVHVIPGHATRVEARLLAEGPRLRVDSDVAGASVFLDRKFLGTTPVDIKDVAPGPHRLNVSAEGYEMYAETVEAPRDIEVRFKEVRLDATVDVVHKHGMGSCQGRLRATPRGLRYETSRREDAFEAPFAQLERLEVDYLKKTLRVALRGGRTYNFTGNADALLTFQKDVESARKRL